MNNIKAIIFDMDGVLIDAKEWHYEALNRALELFGYTISRFEHLVSYDGLPTRRKLQMLSMEKGLPEGLHDFIDQVKQIYTQEIVHTHCKPVFYHEYALAHLKAHGYKLGVASNSVRDSVELMLTKSNLIHYLDVVLSNQDVKKAKPDPEIYQTAIKKLKLKPEQCLIIEDNERGIKAAKASGAHLMVVSAVEEVNLENIQKHINRIKA